MTGELLGGQPPEASRQPDASPIASFGRTAVLERPQATLIHTPRSYVAALDCAELFPKAQPFEVELGSGDGSFMAAYAAAHPERNFLGVERLLGRLRKLDRKGRRLGLSNLKILRLEASYVVEYLLPKNSVEALHIYFPDPWPKRRHFDRRLINARFVEAVRLVLAPSGRVYLRTDDANYFAQMTEVFGANANYRIVETPESLRATLTDFERTFSAKGIPTLRAAYARSDH